ncbi:hypothetical protein RhiirA1_541578 [Rhizophagus irregularis]|uniref:Uncharacterized protein n=1 Tax=Rhizophagus irregularis TaxID=588596 RepID=A0A2N0R2F1_9GLOM|nr:hypothetical protein RhiirA1_541578 [Rhizophagus irregularis]
MKDRLKEKLENDETSAKILMKLFEKGVLFDYLKLKESLWSTFSINRIIPFKDNFSKQQMQTWKASKNVQQVHEDLYKLSDSDDLSSDTYILLIIKSVFASDKEYIVDSWTGNITDINVDSEKCECESSPKTPITPIDDVDEIIRVDHRVDDEHTMDDNL